MQYIPEQNYAMHTTKLCNVYPLSHPRFTYFLWKASMDASASFICLQLSSVSLSAWPGLLSTKYTAALMGPCQLRH